MDENLRMDPVAFASFVFNGADPPGGGGGGAFDDRGTGGGAGGADMYILGAMLIEPATSGGGCGGEAEQWNFVLNENLWGRLVRDLCCSSSRTLSKGVCTSDKDC